MTFEEFIKNYVGEITPAQRAFINWLEDCKKKDFKPFYFNGRGRI